MENLTLAENDTEQRLSARLKQLRVERGWSLDQLASASQVSRATLSRLENGEVSPTTVVLGKLCAAYGLAMSRLLRMVEDDFPPLLRRAEQSVWTDPDSGFIRRSVSPPSRALAGEALECELGAGVTITYAASPRPGMEHHLLLQQGKLNVTVDGRSHDLMPGDCLRYQLQDASAFITPPDSGARYFLFLV
ncbi:helix-turn-helix domain-containing protein [Janthinobacterium sp.]|uniref:helix-turn-helix domain-containing protein n=1 Tax=Janthinobacterium sp. TaxID=1871054 RepID=UPI0026075B23|nr:helix-turn-helix domain-containing protein [Janthinobacterium sp.]